MAGDFGTMKTRIALEMERSGDATFVAQIGDHINSAIQTYRGRRWWFLEGPTSGTYSSLTTPGDSYVSLYAGLIELESLRVTVSGQINALDLISFDEMESAYDGVASSTTGQPFKFNIYAGRVRLFPKPDQAYTLTWKGTFDQTTLSASTDTNDWMTTAEPLIRAHTQYTLYRDVLRDTDGMTAQMQAIAVAIDSLDREHMRRRGASKIRASAF